MKIDRLLRSTKVVPLLATLIVLVPPVVALVKLVSSKTWYPTGDMAQAELHLRGFWSHPPLVGAAGRIESDAGVQGSHPGPSLWIALYPVYALFGRSSAALMTSAVVVHAVFIGAALWLARRFGGLSLMLPLTLGYAAVVRASGPAFFTEPWNPWFAVFPFVIFLLAIWASVDRSPRWFVLAVLAGSHCVQSHVGYLVIVAGLSATTVLVLARRALLARQIGPLVVPGALSIGALALIWLPPIVDQLTRSPGNFSILWQHFGSPREPFLGHRVVLEIFASELSSVGPWLTGPALIERNALLAIPTVLAWGAAVVAGVRSHRRAILRLHAVLAVAVALGGASLLRIFGSYQEYTIRWFWVLTVAILAACAWTFWQVSAQARRDRLRMPLLIGVTVALVGATVMGAVQFGQRAHFTGAQDSAMVGALTPEVEAAIGRRERYLLRWHDPVGLGATPFGLLLELERQGFSVGVDQSFAAAALPHRVLAESSANGLLWVVLGARIEQFRGAAGFSEIASVDLRTAVQRGRYADLSEFLMQRFAEIGQRSLFDRIDAQYGAAGLLFIQPPLPDDIAQAVSELVALRVPAAVFLAPPGTQEPAAIPG